MATNFIGEIGVFGRHTFICCAVVPKRIGWADGQVRCAYIVYKFGDV